MTAQEGVIKFDLRFTPAPPLPDAQVRALLACRAVLHRHGLIGQDPGRYEGAGYGNASLRLPAVEQGAADDAGPRFVITGSQTGGLAVLGPEHLAVVRACRPARNQVVAEGPWKPSSEALTHGMVYAICPEAACVLHVHHPGLWHGAAARGLPVTRREVPYGCPEMAAEVARLFAETDVRQRRLFSMGGHEDGLVAFGASLEEATEVLLRALGEV